MEIIRLGGTERRLYELVAPLVMDAAVIRWNNGYPFKTSDEYTWYVARRGRKVCGFMPVRRDRARSLIDNYYACDDDPQVLAALLAAAVEGSDGGARLEVMSRPGLAAAVGSAPRVGYAHLAMSVGGKEAVDGLTERLRADGYSVVSGPRTTGDSYYESCVEGPEGCLVEITE